MYVCYDRRTCTLCCTLYFAECFGAVIAKCVNLLLLLYALLKKGFTPINAQFLRFIKSCFVYTSLAYIFYIHINCGLAR